MAVTHDASGAGVGNERLRSIVGRHPVFTKLAAFRKLFLLLPVLAGACAGGASSDLATPALPAVAANTGRVPDTMIGSDVPASVEPTPTDAAFARFSGLTEQEVTQLLGRPDTLRRDPPAAVWQYRARDCVLDLFLYDEAGAARVVHAEARPRGIISVSQRGCLVSLAAREPARGMRKALSAGF